jgi:hypothetical protein
MPTSPTPETVKAVASLISLPISDDEAPLVAERLAILLDAHDQFAHLCDSTAELDLHFDARWESASA